MDKMQVMKLIQNIEQYYNNPFTRNLHLIEPGKSKEEKLISVVKLWHSGLEDQDSNLVMKNFMGHVKTNKYPPTIAELRVQKQDEGSKVNHEHLEYMRKLRSGQHGK